MSEEFDIAIHLCACGCGSRVKTPLGPTEWSISETKSGVTLRPSVGNWQQPCRSHYLITRGKIVWAPQWSAEEIAAGRSQEQQRREAYYDALDRKRGGMSKDFGVGSRDCLILSERARFSVLIQIRMREGNMIRDEEIEAKAAELSLTPNEVEKDYVHGWVLRAIASRPQLANTLVLKGGSALKRLPAK